MIDLAKIDPLVAALGALAHPSRLQIMLALTQTGPLPVSVLQHQLQLSLPVLSNHLSHLYEQRLLDTQQQGQELHYTLVDGSIRQAISLIQTNYM